MTKLTLKQLGLGAGGLGPLGPKGPWGPIGPGRPWDPEFPFPSPRPVFPEPLPFPIPIDVPGPDMDVDKIARKLREALAAEEARREEEERRRQTEGAKLSQIPVPMQDLVVRAEATREVHDWLFDSGRDALAKGRVDRAAVYAMALASSTAVALNRPLRMNPLASVEELRRLVDAEDSSFASMLNDPFGSAMLKEVIELAERPGAAQACLDALFRLQTFGGWDVFDAPAGQGENALGLDLIVATEVWVAILYHRWTEIENVLSRPSEVFRDSQNAQASTHRDGLQAMMRSVCALCIYAMHRDTLRLDYARQALAEARAGVPASATRALRALDLLQRAIDDIRAGRRALIALPGAEKMFEATIDSAQFAWTPLLLAAQSTHMLPVNGDLIDLPGLMTYLEGNGALTPKIPFELYDPRLSVWLGLWISLTWAPAVLAEFAASQKCWDICARLLGLCFKYVERVPRPLRGTVEALAVSSLVELARAWSADLYTRVDDAPDDQRVARLDHVRSALGLVAEIPAGALTMRVAALSPLSTAAIDPSWKALIAQALTPGQQTPAALPPALGPALTEIRRRLLFVSRGVLAGGQFMAVAPLWRFEYLFDAANFFVGQAKYTEQRALDYRDRETSSQLQRQQLQDAIEMAQSELAIATRRIGECTASLRVAESNLDLASVRSKGARSRLQVYDQNSDLIRQYQAMAGSLGGGSDGVFSSMQGYIDSLRRTGRTSGPTGYMIGTVTYLAASHAGEIERTSLDSQVIEAGFAEAMAQQQIEAEHVREEIAQSYAEQASLRLVAAQRLLQAFDANASSVTHGELAAFMKRIAEAYYTMALDAAVSAQSAFNYQYRTEITLITPKPRSVAEAGIMASEDLSLKLAQFRFFQFRLGNRRRVPVRWEVRLQDLFPEAMEQLRSTGKCDFALMPGHLCNHFPGLHTVTVLRVGLKSTISRLPGRWVLTNSPKGQFRAADGVIQWRDQTVEARLTSFSDEVLAEEMLQSRLTQNQLEPFENTSPLCTWTLRYAGRRAEVDLNRIQINMVIDLDADFNEQLADVDQASSAERLLANPHVMASTLGTVDSQALVGLLKDGASTFVLPFTVDRDGVLMNLFPEGAAEMKMTGLALRLLSWQGVTKPLTGIKVELDVPCDPAGPAAFKTLSLTTDASGAVDPTSVSIPRSALPLGVFSIRLLRTDGRLNDAGAVLDDLAEVAFTISYQVTKLRGSSRNRP